MGEIRSTIDIMMERTRGMVLSAEERKAYRLNELAKKARGLHLKLTHDPEQTESVLSSLDQESPEDAGLIRSLVWNTFVENLPSGDDTATYLDSMAKFPVDRERLQILEELRLSLKTAAKSRSRDMKTLVAAARKKLAEAGISGSAVVPKVDVTENIYEDILDRYKYLLMYRFD
jgi:hypothetical protein